MTPTTVPKENQHTPLRQGNQRSSAPAHQGTAGHAGAARVGRRQDTESGQGPPLYGADAAATEGAHDGLTEPHSDDGSRTTGANPNPMERGSQGIPCQAEA